MKQTKKNGFTLIELLIVIVILGLLMSLVAPTMFSKVGSTKTKTAAVQMEMIATALDTYRLDMGDYPSTLSELRRSDKPQWDGPYLPKDVPMDPWSNPYIYAVPGENGNPYTMKSYGKNGVAGGEGEDADVIHQ
ncbi:type II secretion system protein GspG [Shewanella sairae]|uniref:Type II secretion system core protein G n=1 Tax=Shewanella sairae TaxID=190310 RepID=A0ABQ4PN85_9GAMM|nr:type II secretion system major pseudopilin GspG [Shewanella sairae]MCL1131414.1 type II secretion system major pseudopilin GspG [Shewanella sairae]GIU49892.1 type II secretion system protein GspG [Shewanella sairae]